MPELKPADQRPDGWDGATSNYEDTVERITARFVPKLFAHTSVGPDTKVLDIAAGTGAVSLAAARVGAAVIATDFSPNMVERLRDRVATEGLANVTVEVMDGQALDLPDGGFDLVTCNFGVIFFPDPSAGFREMHRVLRPQGVAVLTTWGPPARTELAALLGSAVKEVVPDFEFPAPLPGQLPFADPEAVSDALRDAGFGTVEVDTSSETWTLADASKIADLMRTNPGRARMQGLLTPEQDEAITQTAVRILRDRFGDAPPSLSMEAHVFAATKP
jgi:SAM-dependent methyltransferase